MSDLETEDLHVLLAWIDPPARRSGAEAASRVEDERFDGTIPAAGPTPDPEWDRDVLEPLIGAFNRARSGDDSPATVRRLGRPIRSAVRDALTPAWEATWRAIELVRELPAGDSVADRWQADRRSFTNHVDRLERGDARFRTTDSVKQAAFLVRTREQAQADLDANEALDDPLVMAGVIADGAALAGTVTSIDRPDFVVELSGPCNVPVGTELFWTDMPKNASAVVTEIGGPAGDVVVMTLKQGKTKYWPEPGDWVCYSPYSLKRIPPPDMPHGVPWTHMGVSPAQAEPEVPE